jgi:hypothetical protein
MSDGEQLLRDRMRDAAPQPRQFDFDALARRMTRRRRSRTIGGFGVVAALTVVAVVVPLALVSGSSPTSTVAGRKVIRGGPVRSTIILDQLGPETFAPPPPYLHAKLTAQQAFDVFAKRQEPIPARIGYQLGILTDPAAITDVLVWGFYGPPGGCDRSYGLGQAPPSPPPQCIEWDFVSATTGRGVETTFQTIGIPTPAPSPTPDSAIALRSGGFLDAVQQQHSLRTLVMQGPPSTIRWTFDSLNCTISLHWFLPPATQSSPQRAPCPPTSTFTTSLTTDFASRGHVFTVIAGYVPGREQNQLKITLADGETESYPADPNGAWLFAIQRCGNVAGTAIRSVTPVKYRSGVAHAILPPERMPLTGLAAIQKSCQSH